MLTKLVTEVTVLGIAAGHIQEVAHRDGTKAWKAVMGYAVKTKNRKGEEEEVVREQEYPTREQCLQWILNRLVKDDKLDSLEGLEARQIVLAPGTRERFIPTRKAAAVELPAGIAWPEQPKTVEFRIKEEPAVAGQPAPSKKGGKKGK